MGPTPPVQTKQGPPILNLSIQLVYQLKALNCFPIHVFIAISIFLLDIRDHFNI